VFASDYGCPHPGMPLCRNRSRRNRDAPNVQGHNPDQAACGYFLFYLCWLSSADYGWSASPATTPLSLSLDMASLKACTLFFKNRL
jgi:hypothetical protein